MAGALAPSALSLLKCRGPEPAHLGLRSGGTFHGTGGSCSPSKLRGCAEGPASAPALPGRPLPPRRDRGAVRRGDSSLAAEDEEVQPGDSRGLEGSSAVAGEAAGPCSPSVSFSSSVDMRVLSPLRELVSAWEQRRQGTGLILCFIHFPHPDFTLLRKKLSWGKGGLLSCCHHKPPSPSKF